MSQYYENFSLAIVACFCTGFSTSLGDSVIIGFIKGFDASFFSGYSSGTGFSGLFGALWYLLLKFFDVPFHYVLALLLIGYPVYGISFYNVLKTKHDMVMDSYQKMGDQMNIGEYYNLQNIEDETHLINDPVSIKEVQEQESQINQPLSFSLLKHIMKTLSTLYILLFLTFFVEYISLSYISSQIKSQFSKQFPEKEKTPKHINVLFELLLLCYQSGIILSRSSLDCYKVRNVWIVVSTLFLLGISYFWLSFCVAVYSIWVPLILMFVIGYFGGVSYVNIYYQVLKHHQIRKKEKEIASNFTMIIASMGVISSSLIGYLLKLFWLRHTL
jgi:battenin